VPLPHLPSLIRLASAIGLELLLHHLCGLILMSPAAGLESLVRGAGTVPRVSTERVELALILSLALQRLLAKIVPPAHPGTSYRAPSRPTHRPPSGPEVSFAHGGVKSISAGDVGSRLSSR
jgi:hypothetical protein